MEDRQLPTSLQPASARRVLPPRGLKPPLAPLGPDSLRPSTPARSRAPARDPDRRTRLVPRRVPMLRNHTPYDPTKHRALQRHITVTIPSSSSPVPDLAATKRLAGAAITPRAAAGQASSA